MYKLDKYRDSELDTCKLDYWFIPCTWQTQLYFYKVFVQEQASRFFPEKKHKLINPERCGLHSELCTWPSEIPLPVSLIQWSWEQHSNGCLSHSLVLLIPGTLVIWALPLFFHRETAHIPVSAYANKAVSSLNIDLGESQSKSTMFSVGIWSNKEKSFLFWVRTDQLSPGLTQHELFAVFSSSAFFYSSWYPTCPTLLYRPERWWYLCYCSVTWLECFLRGVKNF